MKHKTPCLIMIKAAQTNLVLSGGQTYGQPLYSHQWNLLKYITVVVVVPVLKINNHATGGWRTKDILGGPKGWGPKKVANVEIYVVFEVFDFSGWRTTVDFKDWAYFHYQHVDSVWKYRNTIGPTIPKQGNFCAPNCSSQCRASYNVDRRYYL